MAQERRTALQRNEAEKRRREQFIGVRITDDNLLAQIKADVAKNRTTVSKLVSDILYKHFSS